MGNTKHNIYELQQKQSLPLEQKIILTVKRLSEWCEHYDGDTFLAFSGGKDSTVLLDIIRNELYLYNDIPAVYVDTGLEYPEIKAFVRTINNVTIIRPKLTFHQVIEKYGYPVVSKEVSRGVYYSRKAIAEGREQNSTDYQKLCGTLLKKDGTKSIYNNKKWKFLLDAPFNISHHCCDALKKNPVKRYQKETGRVPIVATMASESRIRKMQWLKTGCNSFESRNPMSKPMSFWTDQDVLEYIYTRKIPYAKEVYGDIVINKNGKYDTTGVKRTGCVYCMFGCHLEKNPNRFQLLEGSQPKLYNYCINGGTEIDGKWVPDNKGLGLGRILDYLNVKYKNDKEPKIKNI